MDRSVDILVQLLQIRKLWKLTKPQVERKKLKKTPMFAAYSWWQSTASTTVSVCLVLTEDLNFLHVTREVVMT